MENQATGLRPMEMHPYPRLSAVLPPKGEVIVAICFEMLMKRLLTGALLSHRFCGGKVVP